MTVKLECLSDARTMTEVLLGLYFCKNER